MSYWLGLELLTDRRPETDEFAIEDHPGGIA
jgi:hypothetical protein